MKTYTFPITLDYTEELIYTSIQQWLSANDLPIHTLVRPDAAIVLVLEDPAVAAEFEDTWAGPPYI